MSSGMRESLVAAAREVGKKHGKTAELDFGAGAEWMFEQLQTENAQLRKRLEELLVDIGEVAQLRARVAELEGQLYALCSGLEIENFDSLKHQSGEHFNAIGTYIALEVKRLKRKLAQAARESGKQ